MGKVVFKTTTGKQLPSGAGKRRIARVTLPPNYICEEGTADWPLRLTFGEVVGEGAEADVGGGGSGSATEATPGTIHWTVSVSKKAVAVVDALKDPDSAGGELHVLLPRALTTVECKTKVAIRGSITALRELYDDELPPLDDEDSKARKTTPKWVLLPKLLAKLLPPSTIADYEEKCAIAMDSTQRRRKVGIRPYVWMEHAAVFGFDYLCEQPEVLELIENEPLENAGGGEGPQAGSSAAVADTPQPSLTVSGYVEVGAEMTLRFPKGSATLIQGTRIWNEAEELVGKEQPLHPVTPQALTEVTVLVAEGYLGFLDQCRCIDLEFEESNFVAEEGDLESIELDFESRCDKVAAPAHRAKLDNMGVRALTCPATAERYRHLLDSRSQWHLDAMDFTLNCRTYTMYARTVCGEWVVLGVNEQNQGTGERSECTYLWWVKLEKQPANSDELDLLCKKAERDGAIYHFRTRTAGPYWDPIDLPTPNHFGETALIEKGECMIFVRKVVMDAYSGVLNDVLSEVFGKETVDVASDGGDADEDVASSGDGDGNDNGAGDGGLPSWWPWPAAPALEETVEAQPPKSVLIEGLVCDGDEMVSLANGVYIVVPGLEQNDSPIFRKQPDATNAGDVVRALEPLEEVSECILEESAFQFARRDECNWAVTLVDMREATGATTPTETIAVAHVGHHNGDVADVIHTGQWSVFDFDSKSESPVVGVSLSELDYSKLQVEVKEAMKLIVIEAVVDWVLDTAAAGDIEMFWEAFLGDLDELEECETVEQVIEMVDDMLLSLNVDVDEVAVGGVGVRHPPPHPWKPTAPSFCNEPNVPSSSNESQAPTCCAPIGGFRPSTQNNNFLIKRHLSCISAIKKDQSHESKRIKGRCAPPPPPRLLL
jgi:hypothetical protein